MNRRAVARASELIALRQYVLDSNWGEVQPNAEAEAAPEWRASAGPGDLFHHLELSPTERNKLEHAASALSRGGGR